MDETQFILVEDQAMQDSSDADDSGKGIMNLGKAIQDCKKSSDNQFAFMKEQFAAILAVLSKKTVYNGEIPPSGISGSNPHPSVKRYEHQPLNLSEVNLPKFRGDNPEAWLRNCESCFQFHLIKYEDWVNLAESYLEDRARIWYTSWKLDKRLITWTIFCNELCKWFSKQHNNEFLAEASQVEQPQVSFVKSARKVIDKMSQSIENVRVDGLYLTKDETTEHVLIDEELNEKSELEFQEETTSNQNLGHIENEASNVGTQLIDGATKLFPSKLKVVKAAHKMLDKMTDSSLTEAKDEDNSCEPVLLRYELFGNEEGQPHLVIMRSIKGDHRLLDKMPELIDGEKTKDSTVCWPDDLRNEAGALGYCSTEFSPKLDDNFWDENFWDDETSMFVFDPGGSWYPMRYHHFKPNNVLIFLNMSLTNITLEQSKVENTFVVIMLAKNKSSSAKGPAPSVAPTSKVHDTYSSEINSAKWMFGLLTNYSMFSTQAVSCEDIMVGVCLKISHPCQS